MGGKTAYYERQFRHPNAGFFFVILVLAVAIYDAGSFYVINQYSSIYFLLRNVEDPSSVTLHRLTWLDSDKEEGALFIVGIEHRHIPLESATKRTFIRTTLAHTGGTSSHLYPQGSHGKDRIIEGTNRGGRASGGTQPTMVPFEWSRWLRGCGYDDLYYS